MDPEAPNLQTNDAPNQQNDDTPRQQNDDVVGMYTDDATNELSSDAPNQPSVDPQSQPSNSQQPSRLARRQSWAFFCCWHVVLLMHIAIVLAYSFQAVLFAYVNANAKVRTMVSYLGESVVDFLPAVAGFGGMNAGLHGLAILSVLFWSLRHCTLLVSKPEAPTADAQQRQQPSKWSAVLKLVARLYRDDEGSTMVEQNAPWYFGLLGLSVHDLELALDLALQTYEAEKLSRLVTREWINRFASLVLVANCWLTPLVRLIFRKHHSATRDVARIMLESLLTMLFWIAVPVAIVYPYAREFDSETQAFPFINYYMDTWYINAFTENRQFFVTSWVDFVAKMLPGLGLLLRLHQLKDLLATHKEFGSKGVRPSGDVEAGASGQSVRFRDRSPTSKCKIVVKWLYNLVLVSWGVTVLALHSHATAVASTNRDPGCLLELQPWGAATYDCVVLEVSCSQKQIKGEKAKIQAVLANVNIDRVQGLIFSHCPALELPSQLQRASKLQVLKIHNCTVSQWNADAALTAATHPTMQQLFVSLTNLPGSTIPDGLLSSAFPTTLFDMSFCGTDLTALPDDVPDKWTGVQYFTLELSPGIKKPPAALGKLPSCEWLSLSGNAITGIPDTRFADSRFVQLYLDGNPLQALPSNLGDVSRTQIVSVTNTEVSSVPSSWASFGATSAILAASGSPLCQASAASAGALRLDCNASYDNTHLFPLEWEQYWRKKNHK
ncbi:hypothetical protein PybrP1_011317 [[Pythium] brassicae (nom. inval.)]|nr:hypothetical protein PybrP1_011317 [[Pythium] brassicae (nom. inval.)]